MRHTISYVWAIVLLSSGCAHLRAECSQHGGPAWRLLSTEHFELATDLEPAKAEATARAFERSRKALLFALRTQLDPPQRVRAIVLRQRSELTEFADQHVLGFMTTDERGPVVVAAGTAAFIESAPNLRTVTHELAHLFATLAFVRQPRWFAEGLASYLETMVADPATEVATVGAPHPRHLEFVRSQGALPLETLWSWPADLVADNYASSWVWVHFLINRYPREFEAFELGLANAVEPRQAWIAAFAQHSPPRLEHELAGYVQTGAYEVTQVHLDEHAEPITQAALSDADVHVLRARLWHLTQAPEGAKADVAMALRLDPTNVQATELQLRTAEPSARLALARAFVEKQPNAPAAWQLLARALPPAEAEQAWREALARAPEDAEALMGVARFEAPARALPMLSRAVAAQPWNPTALLAQAAAFAALGRCDEANEAHHRALEVLPDDALPTQRQHVEEAGLTLHTTCRARPRP